MDLNNIFRHYTKAFPNQAANGVLGAVADLTNTSSWSIAQTTAGIALSLPTPAAGTTTKIRLWVSNIGTMPVIVAGHTIGPASEAHFYYHNGAWSLSSPPSGSQLVFADRRWVASANTAVTLPGNAAVTVVPNIVNDINIGGIIATFDGTTLVITSSASSVEVEVLLQTTGSGNHSANFYLRNVADPIGTRFGDGAVPNGVSTFGTYGQGSTNTPATAIVPPNTTVTLNIVCQASGNNQVVNAGSYVRATEITGTLAFLGTSLLQPVAAKYINATRAANTATLAVNDAVLFTASTGNILYNATTGLFTLKANETYRLTAGARIVGASTAELTWMTAANVQIVPMKAGNASAVGDYQSIEIIYTPNSDTDVKLAPVSVAASPVLRGGSIGATIELIASLPANGPNFYSGNTSIPTSTIPTSAPFKGDTYVVTSDGTVNGFYQGTWYYDGIKWVPGAPGLTSIASVAPGIRSYHPSTTAYHRYLADPVAGDLAAQGFSVVGGATMAPSGSVWNSMGLWNISANVATAPFTAPTQYIRHEVVVTPTTANTYFLKILGDRETVIEVWVCNATTGVPEKRLAAKAVSSTTAGTKNTIQLSPLEEYGSDNDFAEWAGFEIPLDLITTYKTAGNIIKLAIRPGLGHTTSAVWYLAGWAMASTGIAYTVNHAFSFDNVINGGTQIAVAGTQDGIAYSAIAANTAVNGFRVALPAIDKDVYLSLVSLGNPGNRSQWLEFTIAHPSGNVLIGRPRPHLKSPLADAALRDIGDNSLPVGGWVIPAATLAAKSILPTNSGIRYLELNAINRAPSSTAYIVSIVAEQTN